MKSSVVINGVILTRQQVEEAVRELEAPEVFEPGSHVQYDNWAGRGGYPLPATASTFVVVNALDVAGLAASTRPGTWLCSLDTGSIFNISASNLKVVKEPKK